MAEDTDCTSVDNVAIKPCKEYKVLAIKDWKGEELDDLSFLKGDIITVVKKDATGWASGHLKDGNKGWFPLDCVEEIHDNAVAEVGTNTGKTALDAFINEATKKPEKKLHLNVKLQSTNRNNSLNEFLATKPMEEKTIPDNKISGEVTDEVEAAKKRLAKLQKNRKKERAETFMESLRNDWKPSNPCDLTEDQFNSLIINVLNEIPLSKQKYHFSSYEDVFNGSTLLQTIQTNAHRIKPSWENTAILAEEVKTLAKNLVERNIIIDVADPGRKKFKKKSLYQLYGHHTDYTVLNFNKISSYEEVDGYKLSIELIGEMIELMKQFLPNLEKLRKSSKFLFFGLRLAALQNVVIDNLDDLQKKVFFINIANTMVLYCHAKFTPPLNAPDKRLLYEFCSIYTDSKRFSIQDLQHECLKFASKKDPGVYFCISDCCKSTPAVYIFSSLNFEMTQLYAIRHFLNRALFVDSSNYEITFPKIFQSIAKDLGFEDNQLIDFVKPYCSKDHRDDIDKMKEVGNIDVKFAQYDFKPHYVFEEASSLSPR